MAHDLPHATVVQRSLRDVLELNRRVTLSVGQATAIWPFIQLLDARRYASWQRRNESHQYARRPMPEDTIALLLWPLAPSALATAVNDHVITQLAAPPLVEFMPARTAPDLAVTYALIRWLRRRLDERSPVSLGTPVAELRTPTGRRRMFSLDLMSELYVPDLEPAGGSPEQDVAHA